MLLATVALMVVAASAVATAATPVGETSTHLGFAPSENRCRPGVPAFRRGFGLFLGLISF